MCVIWCNYLKKNLTDHRTVVDADKEPLVGLNLVNLRGQKWKDMRATLSPVFTGSKMRFMFELVSEIGAQMAKYFKHVSEKDRVVEFKEIFSRFTTDVIASTSFGIQVDSLKDKKNVFYMTAESMLNFKGFITGIRLMIVFMLPKLSKFLGLRMISEKTTNFFTNIITETMNTREAQGIVRPDLIHLLMQLKKGMLKLETSNEAAKPEEESFAAVEESEVGRVVVRRQWSDNALMAQCLIFFLAGYDTSSSVMSMLAYELATNKDVQEKLLQEIDQVNETLAGNRLTYDALQKMKYLDMVITEGLRVWPAAELTDRTCVKDYKMQNDQGTEFIIKSGENVWIPIIAYHMDSNSYVNPKNFDPERFSDENKSNINPSMYMPFGIGPRNCIGSRFALMQMKCAFYYLLLNFTLEVCDKTQIPLKLVKGTRTQPEKGIWLELRPRNE